MKKVPLSEVKDDLSRYLHDAEKEEVIITRHGKPAGLLIGFETEDDWFDYRLERDPRFLRRIELARDALRAGKGVRIEALDEALAATSAPSQAGEPRSKRTRARRVARSSGARSKRRTRG